MPLFSNFNNEEDENDSLNDLLDRVDEEFNTSDYPDVLFGVPVFAVRINMDATFKIVGVGQVLPATDDLSETWVADLMIKDPLTENGQLTLMFKHVKSEVISRVGGLDTRRYNTESLPVYVKYFFLLGGTVET